MYIFDEDNNILKKAAISTFKDLNLEERKHLQEWIATEPTMLGEDLLIIQKEFDGFDGTRERLDLLALDKEGNLVIIENKLDDSGRDVTWQAIKYASYCSSLTKDEIVKIYQQYLGVGVKAEDKISDFMEKPYEEVDLNGERTQRIFFVAANFRKEVTTSVLWLQTFGLNIKCFKVTPFKYNGRVLIDFDQIIPVKDTEEYIIKMASKKQEEAQAANATQLRREKHQAFWLGFIDYNKKHKGPFVTANGTADNLLGKSLGISGISCCVVLNKTNVRTEIYICWGTKEQNKETFDSFFAQKETIEDSLPEYPIRWQRLDDKISCRIFTERTDLGLQNEEDYPAIYEFFTESSRRFIDVFGPLVRDMK